MSDQTIKNPLFPSLPLPLPLPSSSLHSLSPPLVLPPPHPLFSPPLYPVVVRHSSICHLEYCMYMQGLTECWQYCMNIVWNLMLLQVLIRCCRSECDHNLGDDTSLIHTRGGALSKLGVEPTLTQYKLWVGPGEEATNTCTHQLCTYLAQCTHTHLPTLSHPHNSP